MHDDPLLWKPGRDFVEASNLKHYERWLSYRLGRRFETYNDLWEWSTHHTGTFWDSLWAFFDIQSHTPYRQALTSEEMPGAVWFEGATLNYAEHIFRNATSERPALYVAREGEPHRAISWHDLEQDVIKVVRFLKARGIGQGDRVAAYVPNIPEAIVAFLAVNAIGAVWSCCSPDFGVKTVIDRFAQIEPVCLFVIDGYMYHGKAFDRSTEVEAIRQTIPSIRHTVQIEYLNSGSTLPGTTPWADIMSASTGGEALAFTPVPFDHPIWVLYSSGTTGKPKAITHSHGGVLLEHLKYLVFHNDVHPGEHFFWFTTTGWMMWNFLQASMLTGAVPVLYDGSPAYPDLSTLWKLAAALPIHHFGTSAPFLVACMKEGLTPGKDLDLSELRSIGSTGAPLPPDAFDWVYEAISKEVWLCSMSGGTDVCTAFVGGCPYEPVRRGRIQCRCLGCAMEAYDEQGNTVYGRLGEMVIEKAMPSMPIYFWGDPSGERYRSSYFSQYPGIWRHGDWLKVFEDGSLEIHGRSDATLNRKGVRIGTAEIYAILDGIEGIKDSMILNLEFEEDDVMPLFVVLADGQELDDALQLRIKRTLKEQGSPRHVPDRIVAVPDIPYTLSGKKMEVPVKNILMGQPVGDAMNKDAVRNPRAVEYFFSIASTFREDMGRG